MWQAKPPRSPGGSAWCDGLFSGSHNKVVTHRRGDVWHACSGALQCGRCRRVVMQPCTAWYAALLCPSCCGASGSCCGSLGVLVWYPSTFVLHAACRPTSTLSDTTAQLCQAVCSQQLGRMCRELIEACVRAVLHWLMLFAVHDHCCDVLRGMMFTDCFGRALQHKKLRYTVLRTVDHAPALVRMHTGDRHTTAQQRRARNMRTETLCQQQATPPVVREGRENAASLIRPL